MSVGGVGFAVAVSAAPAVATTPAPPVPSTRTAVLAIVALALGGFAIGTTEFVTMGLLPDIADGVDVSIPSAGHVISAYAIGVVIGSPVIAALGARLPRRALAMALMTAFVVGNALSALAPGYGSLVLARFVAGLPHGAYFGVASLIAASLVPAHLRGRAVSSVMLGLAISNVAGVPAATWLGQNLGWRSAYWAVVVIAGLTVLAVLLVVPSVPGRAEASIRAELEALRRPQVLLTLSFGIVGFGGMFALYSYIAPLVTDVAGASAGFVPVALLVFGFGMVAGTALGGRLADRALFPSLVGAVVAMVAFLTAVVAGAGHPASLLVAAFLVAMASSVLAVCLQLRLMEVAGDAQMLGAALNHSALNLANALGAWLGGLVIAAGFGYRAPSAVGAGLAVVGLGLLAASAVLRRREVTAGRAR
ncbi:MAG: Arabinose efflux permease family protein [Modestobacter sp.]|jgi:DHA1 family inner membrane transport protein|nr:Arabinose efflux permease family protein [Modestobacter sp.]MCW2510715.1 Arabinose efflux permease family protein [Modestobacter sp.]MCW2575691.1 Arabinose efflux permease family protein [Modestobacter sp.]MCW2619581.1 Arabinose efflux permease family protein [Modestobacter sp.]